MIEPILVGVAFLAGLGFRRAGMPPLLGYLLAGFLAGGLELGDADIIHTLSEVGITLLLFTIGLKLNIRELLAPQIWATASLHTLIVVPLTTAVLLG
ncbi:MAG: putative Kef-type K+ transport protein, partial [Zhongshania sp.]